MSRKTFDVEKLRAEANRLLALPEGGAWNDRLGEWDGKTSPWGTSETVGNPAWRAGVASLLEFVLHETDNYRGFNLQSSEWLPEEEQNYDHNRGPIRMMKDNADESRKVFY